MKAVGEKQILAGCEMLAVRILLPARRDGRADEPLHLVAEAWNRAPVAACGLEPKLRHESRQRRAEFQLAARRADGLRGHPDQNQPRIAAIGQPRAADIGDAEREAAIGARVMGTWLAAVRKSGLDEEFGDEADGSGVIGAFAEIVFE